jgi:membrane protein implicated in regulation of membrane protease activity
MARVVTPTGGGSGMLVILGVILLFVACVLWYLRTSWWLSFFVAAFGVIPLVLGINGIRRAKRRQSSY